MQDQTDAEWQNRLTSVDASHVGKSQHFSANKNPHFVYIQDYKQNHLMRCHYIT